MSGTGDGLTELHTTARAIFGHVQGLEDRWRRGTLDAGELDRLTRAVWLLQVDVELHAPAADPPTASDREVLAAIREGLDAAIATVAGLVDGQAPAGRGTRR